MVVGPNKSGMDDVQMEELVSSQKSSLFSSKADGAKLRGHRLSATCVCIDSKGEIAFSGSKEGSIIKWCVKSNKILAKIPQATKDQNESKDEPKQKSKKSSKQLLPHTRHINCMAISSDDKYLVTGGWDRLIRVWSVDTLELLDSLAKHKDEITGLVFRVDQPTLYSASADRSVIIWSFEDEEIRAYVESLYGHESPITSIDTLRKERVITSGGRDQSIRVWKIVEQAQTVFQSKHESVDIVRLVDDRIFVSGGEDGSICVWTTMKRSPVVVLRNAHEHRNEEIKQEACNWITALAAVSLKDAKQSTTQASKKRKLNPDEDFQAAFDGQEGDEDDNDDDDDDGERGAGSDDEDNDKSKKVLGLVASGSCNSLINVWKLTKTAGKYSLVLHKSFECSGFINDLRFSSDNKKLVAACGQEHKAGRWWKLKKAKNCLKVFKLNNEEVD